MKLNSIAAALLGLALAQGAQADESYWSHVKTDWLGFAPGAKPFYFRAGYTVLAPDSSSTEVYLEDVSGPADLAVDNGPIEGSGASVEDTDFPSVILGWRLPWGDGNWALETVLALPLTVEFKTTGTLANESIAPYALGNIPTGVPPLGTEFGESKALPPVVTLLYRFLAQSSLRPYVGAGFAYMITYDSEVTNPVLTAVGEPELEIDDVFGVAFQAGLEYKIAGDWWVNADLKYIAGLEATATVKDIWVETPNLPTYGVARVGNARMDVTVDPWVFQLGVGFDF